MTGSIYNIIMLAHKRIYAHIMHMHTEKNIGFLPYYVGQPFCHVCMNLIGHICQLDILVGHRTVGVKKKRVCVCCVPFFFFFFPFPSSSLAPGYYHQYYLRRRVSDDASGHCPCGHDDADAGAVADDNRFVLGGGDRGRGALRPKDKNNNHIRNDPFDVPTIFVVTPTRPRMTQMVDLTSLCHTLMHVRGLHWLVVEESDTRTSLVSNLLHRSAVCVCVCVWGGGF